MNNNYYNYTKKRFAFWAKFYDYTWLPINYLRKKTVDFCNLSKTQNILDVATGTGKLAAEFAKNINIKITGLDLSADMIVEAKKKYQQANLKFIVGDSTQMPFQDESFDLITISFALHEMPLEIAQKTILEIKRVLKKDGQFVIIDFTKNKKFLNILSYPFIKLFECQYYAPYLKFDLQNFLQQNGMIIKEEKLTLFSIAKLIKINKI